MATQMQIPDKLKQDGATSHIIIECTNDDQTKPKAGGQDVGGSNGKIWCIFGALLILVSATSVIALAVSLVALRSSETMSEFKEMDYTQSDGDSDKSVLFQVKAMLDDSDEMKSVDSRVPSGGDTVLESGYHRSQRSVEDENLCSSSNESSAKPLAHILHMGPRPKTQMRLSNIDRFSVLTKDWVCKGSAGGLQAMVRGGMIFHGSSGFLELPVSGVYYVYHQVMFRPRGKVIRAAKTRLVACVPGEDCSYLTNDNDPYMQTESDLIGRYGNSKFQGGLFHFEAGSQIAILVWNELYNKPDQEPIRYDNHGYSTYMGAYLVDPE